MRLGYEDQLASGLVLPRLLAQLTFYKLSAPTPPHSTNIAIPSPMEVAIFGIADSSQDSELVMPEQSSHPTVKELSNFTIDHGKKLIDAGFSTISGDSQEDLDENERDALDTIRRALTTHISSEDDQPTHGTGMYL